jgi:hypothetical protein
VLKQRHETNSRLDRTRDTTASARSVNTDRPRATRSLVVRRVAFAPSSAETCCCCTGRLLSARQSRAPRGARGRVGSGNGPVPAVFSSGGHSWLPTAVRPGRTRVNADCSECTRPPRFHERNGKQTNGVNERRSRCTARPATDAQCHAPMYDDALVLSWSGKQLRFCLCRAEMETFLTTGRYVPK